MAGDDLKSQTAQAFRNIVVALAANGATTADVAKITFYVVDWTPEKLGPLLRGRDRGPRRRPRRHRDHARRRRRAVRARVAHRDRRHRRRRLMDFETVRYEVDGHGRDDHARPSRRRERAELADDRRARRRVRRAPRPTTTSAWSSSRRDGKHFSAGHDLKEILRGRGALGRDARRRPRASSSTSRSCTGTSSCGSATSRRSRSPRCRARARAAGLMLACMCDLIVAADDAAVLQPGAAHERASAWSCSSSRGSSGRARRRSSCSAPRRSTPAEAERFGLVNRVVPRAELAAAAARDGRRGRARARRSPRSGQGHDQPHGRPAWASASPGSTTSWCTSS